jgi:NADPH:quinone reductase-like Zn-dependent oxidoreductase
MKAIVQDKYGQADVLELRDVEKPQPGDDELLVRVHAAGVDPGVWHLMTGLPYLVRVMGFGVRKPRIRVRGMDAAGTVEAVGRNVTHLKEGDAVYGTCDGSFAEYACARAERFAPKPANLSFEQAAAVFAPLSSLIAEQKLLGLISKERQQDLLTLKDLIEAGKLTPVIDRTYPLSEAPQAIRYLEQGHARGKVVLTVSEQTPR